MSARTEVGVFRKWHKNIICILGDLGTQGTLDWTGALVERLSNLTLGAFLKKYILEPCGVTEITQVQIPFVSGTLLITPSLINRFEIPPEMKDRLAGAHYRRICGTLSPRGPFHSLDNVQAHLGGHGAYGTIDAFAQVLLPLINEGRHRTSFRCAFRSSELSGMNSYDSEAGSEQRSCEGDVPRAAKRRTVGVAR